MTVYILHYADDILTDLCASAWLAQTSDVLVIDNGSPKPYTSLTGVAILRLNENLHLIPANNAGMKAHPSGWYFCVNNDVFPSLGCLDRMLSVFANDPDVGVAAPGSSDMGAGILYVRPGDSREDVETRHVDNHAWFFTQDVIDEIGYPTAEGHSHRANWACNKEYCWRARKVGYKVMAVRSAYVDHRRTKGYDPVADEAGLAWLKARFAEQMMEIW
jgi:GT2 family glycosyltransferase